MKRYEVVATGVLGNEYVYSIPAAKSEMDAACQAYAVHGIALRLGDRSEALGPQHTVEELS